MVRTRELSTKFRVAWLNRPPPHIIRVKIKSNPILLRFLDKMDPNISEKLSEEAMNILKSKIGLIKREKGDSASKMEAAEKVGMLYCKRTV